MKLKNYINEESVIDRFPNNNLLTEDGLSRLINNMEDKNFAVLTVNGSINTKNDNRKLRSFFNMNKMGVYQLVGHWRECQIENVDYSDCPKDKLMNVIERSYLVTKPTDMSQDKFNDIILELTKKYKQDAAILSIDGDIFILENTGDMNIIGTKVTLNKINQAYSQFVKKMNVPFVFEVEVPSSISGHMIFEMSGVMYPVDCKAGEYREISELYSIPFDKLSKFLNEASDDQVDRYRKALKEENVIDLIDILEEISYD